MIKVKISCITGMLAHRFGTVVQAVGKMQLTGPAWYALEGRHKKLFQAADRHGSEGKPSSNNPTEASRLKFTAMNNAQNQEQRKQARHKGLRIDNSGGSVNFGALLDKV